MAGKYEYIVNASRDFITLINRKHVYDFVNDSYCREMGKTKKEILGKSVEQVWGREKYEKRLKKFLDEGFAGRETHDIDKFRFGEDYKYMHVSYYPYFEGGEVSHVLVYSHDISIIKGLESRLLDFEFKDATTGLFNRKSFDIVLEMELEKAKRSHSDKVRAVFFINLMSFSAINAGFGQDIGDLLLESTGIRVREVLRSTDYVFRYEGKELAVILTTIKRPTDVTIVAQHILEKVSIPYAYKNTSIHLDCNIGISVYPEDGTDNTSLIRNAMSAMGEAMRRKEKFIIFNEALHKKSIYVSRVKTDIRKALLEEQFDLKFQPIVDTEGRMVGAETLIRWEHPEFGPISPSEFIPLAEESGDIIMIGRWVLYKACACIMRWKNLGGGGLYLTVNLSAREFENEDLIDVVNGILQKFEGLDPARLKLEITETQSMRNPEDTIRKIGMLHEKGIEVMVDDFGSGYSSLSYLKRLPVKEIKIDKAFVDGIVDDEGERKFAMAMVNIIRARGKEAFVEGVTSREQFELLKKFGCVKFQGYYFCEPVSCAELEDYLELGGTLPVALSPQRVLERGSPGKAFGFGMRKGFPGLPDDSEAVEMKDIDDLDIDGEIELAEDSDSL